MPYDEPVSAFEFAHLKFYVCVCVCVFVSPKSSHSCTKVDYLIKPIRVFDLRDEEEIQRMLDHLDE